MGDFSMAESFRIAGARNVIAVIDPIREGTATDFAIALYGNIASGQPFHDAFYGAKNAVCPDDRIVLYE